MESAAGTRERVHGLDLLRTAAIVAVVVWHLPRSVYPFEFRPATWAGVDLFFVLSGYLIGSQLLRPYAKGTRPQYVDFLLRRAFRIFPAFLVILLIYFTVPQFREQPGIPPLWRFLSFTQNFGLDARREGAFSHAWSLCVEEHFYLLLPFVVWGFMRSPSASKVLIISALIVVGGIAIRTALWFHYIPSLEIAGSPAFTYLRTIYYPTYARLDGLLVGVLLAAAKLFRPVLWTRVASHGNLILGAAAVVLSFGFWICQDMFSLCTAAVGYPLLALGFGLLVMSSLSPGGVLTRHRIIGTKWGATLAFSTYLTHKAVMHLDQMYLAAWLPLKGWLGLAVYGTSFLAVAASLFLLVERPFLVLRDKVLGRQLKSVPIGVSGRADTP